MECVEINRTAPMKLNFKEVIIICTEMKSYIVITWPRNVPMLVIKNTIYSDLLHMSYKQIIGRVLV